MNISQHAMIRCQQRGILPQHAELIVAYGKHYWHKGAKVFFLPAKVLKRLVRRKTIKPQQADKMNNVFVVYGEQQIITTFRPNKSIHIE